MDKVCNEGLYESTSMDTGVDIKVVKEIVNAQSLFTKYVIESGSLETVTMPYLGKVKPNEKKLNKLKERLTNERGNQTTKSTD